MGFFSMIKGIINIFTGHNKEKPAPTLAQKTETKFENPIFHRTPKEEELSFAFSEKHCEKISEMESMIYGTVQAAHTKIKKDASAAELKVQIKKCDAAIKAFEKMKRYCYRTKGGAIYFQDMWEYCHNSKNKCFSYIDQTIELKKALEEKLEQKNT